MKPTEHRHDGKLLGLRVLNADATSYGGFKNPTTAGAVVEAPDWIDNDQCGNGLHFWPWGIGREGKDHFLPGMLWQVVEIDCEAGVSQLGGKAKCRRLSIVCTGDQASAVAMLFSGYHSFCRANSKPGESATGYGSSSAATGDRSSSAATGYGSSSAATGHRSSSAATGDGSAAICTGEDSTAKAGKYGCVCLAWWNHDRCQTEMRCLEIGCGDGSDGKGKADTWYRLSVTGEFEEVA